MLSLLNDALVLIALVNIATPARRKLALRALGHFLYRAICKVAS